MKIKIRVLWVWGGEGIHVQDSVINRITDELDFNVDKLIKDKE